MSRVSARQSCRASAPVRSNASWRPSEYARVARQELCVGVRSSWRRHLQCRLRVTRASRCLPATALRFLNSPPHTPKPPPNAARVKTMSASMALSGRAGATRLSPRASTPGFAEPDRLRLEGFPRVNFGGKPFFVLVANGRHGDPRADARQSRAPRRASCGDHRGARRRRARTRAAARAGLRLRRSGPVNRRRPLVREWLGRDRRRATRRCFSGRSKADGGSRPPGADR